MVAILSSSILAYRMMHGQCFLSLGHHPAATSSCRYTRDEDDVEALERDATEESGWKLVHGDVFRPPRHPELLSALVGTGEHRHPRGICRVGTACTVMA